MISIIIQSLIITHLFIYFFFGLWGFSESVNSEKRPDYNSIDFETSLNWKCMLHMLDKQEINELKTKRVPDRYR